MSRFLLDAESLFDAAAGSQSESGATDLAIAVGPGGAIRITEASGWDLTALQVDSGARSVYRVSRNARGVRVEGRNGARSCLLTAEAPALTARRLLNRAPSLLPAVVSGWPGLPALGALAVAPASH